MLVKVFSFKKKQEKVTHIVALVHSNSNNDTICSCEEDEENNLCNHDNLVYNFIYSGLKPRVSSDYVDTIVKPIIQFTLAESFHNHDWHSLHGTVKKVVCLIKKKYKKNMSQKNKIVLRVLLDNFLCLREF